MMKHLLSIVKAEIKKMTSMLSLYHQSFNRLAIADTSDSMSYIQQVDEENTSDGNCGNAHTGITKLTEIDQQVEEELKKLPKELYEPFIMYLEGYKKYEISAYLNITEKQVTERIDQAREILDLI